MISCFGTHLSQAQNNEEVKTIFENEDNSALLFETGYHKPLSQLEIDDVEGLRAALTNYHCIIKVKAAMHQFLEGLQMGGVAEYTRTHPQLLKPFLQHIPLKVHEVVPALPRNAYRYPFAIC